MTWRWPFKQTNDHVGGYPLMAIVTVYETKETVFKTHLDPSTAVRLAGSVWKNNQPLDEVWVVNMKTGNRRDIISREVD